MTEEKKKTEFTENKLKELIGVTGILESVYGGFHITVTHEKNFDFPGVLRELLSCSHSIYIEKDSYGRIKIVTD